MAMNAYRNYSNNTSALSKNLEKLSSGYKINRAGDDAAGLAISEKMRAQITGLDAAQKNVKDGISLVKTAEGAMQEIQDMLNRMDYLATQSANGTYDNDVDRANLQKEVEALQSEIDRIAESTNFNGIKLLDGSLSSTEVTGADLDGVVYDNVTVTAVRDGTSPKNPAKGQYEIDLSQSKWQTATAGGAVRVTISGIALGTTPNANAAITVTVAGTNKGSYISGADVAKEIMNKIAASGGKVNVGGKEFVVSNNNGKLTFNGTDTSAVSGTAAVKVSCTMNTAGDLVQTNTNGGAGNQGWVQGWTQKEEPYGSAGPMVAQGKFMLSSMKGGVVDGTTIKIGDTSYTFAVGKNSQFKKEKNVIDMTDYEASSEAGFWKDAANRLSGVANSNSSVYVEADNNTGEILLTEKYGGLDRTKYDVIGESAKSATDATWKDPNSGNSLIQVGKKTSPTEEKEADTGGLTLQIGDTSDNFNQLRVQIGDMHVSAIGIGNISVATQSSAQEAVQSIKDAINYVSSVRGTLGATQNRLEHTQNNLSVMAENIQDAESTIRDTDVASEMMSYVKNNILVQSAQAMLAQANQVPQGVLQLLG